MACCSALICCPQKAPKLLIHVSMLLVLIAGSGLATLARLKWDPSTYLIIRGLLPDVYWVLSATLCFSTFMLIVLAHLSIIGLSQPTPRKRRFVYLWYFYLMLTVIIVELGALAWLIHYIVGWIISGVPRDIISNVLTLIKTFDTFIPGRRKRQLGLGLVWQILGELKSSLEEIMIDVPLNIVVAAAYIVSAAILQPLAALLALNCACPRYRKYVKADVPVRYHNDNVYVLA